MTSFLVCVFVVITLYYKKWPSYFFILLNSPGKVTLSPNQGRLVKPRKTAYEWIVYTRFKAVFPVIYIKLEGSIVILPISFDAGVYVLFL